MGTLALEQHYTVEQLATLWAVSPVTVRRMFRDLPGVLKAQGRRTSSKARSYETLRIPASVAARVHEERSAGFSLEIKRRRG